MSAPFCTACGATVAEGTRFCVKCGQPVGHAAPLPTAQTTVFMPPPVTPPPVTPPSPPPAVAEAPRWTPPPPPPPPPPPFMQPPLPQPPEVQPVRQGPGAGLWIGIFGILLLLGGAGLWLYTTRGPGAHGVLTARDTPTAVPTVSPEPAQPTPTPTSTFVPAPTPNPESEVIPPNPDQAPKDAAPTPTPAGPSRRPAQPRSQPTPQPPPQPDPEPVQPRVARQTSGVLHASVEVALNGEVVFENLPGGRLKFTFDHSAWQPTISRQANGTQTLVMRSLKAGIQRTCDVRWEIIQ
jgi:zinc-ribbon domain